LVNKLSGKGNNRKRKKPKSDEDSPIEDPPPIRRGRRIRVAPDFFSSTRNDPSARDMKTATTNSLETAPAKAAAPSGKEEKEDPSSGKRKAVEISDSDTQSDDDDMSEPSPKKLLKASKKKQGKILS
jgi:hypothetical protein